MNKCLALFILTGFVVLFTSINAFPLTGTWRGDLSVGKVKLPLVFNFFEKDGRTRCTLLRFISERVH